jgi:hypothetical protein
VTTCSEHSAFIVQETFNPKDSHLCEEDIDIDTLNEETEALWKNTKHRLACHMQQNVTEQKSKF